MLFFYLVNDLMSLVYKILHLFCNLIHLVDLLLLLYYFNIQNSIISLFENDALLLTINNLVRYCLSELVEEALRQALCDISDFNCVFFEIAIEIGIEIKLVKDSYGMTKLCRVFVKVSCGKGLMCNDTFSFYNCN